MSCGTSKPGPAFIAPTQKTNESHLGGRGPLAESPIGAGLMGMQREASLQASAYPSPKGDSTKLIKRGNMAKCLLVLQLFPRR